jgi:thymidylate synthase (FAD)
LGEIEPKVTLVEYTPHPDALIASAAKLCYAEEIEGILDRGSGESRHFVRRLRQLGHMSPIEHASFTFLIQGVSRAMTHQLVRHRIASYSQRSQRYVPHREFDYVVPPQFAGKKIVEGGKKRDAVGYFHETMRILAERYAKLNEALGNQGESSNEDARYVLPNACESKIFVTMNARELLHFFEERLCLRAQWEIRRVGNMMLELALGVCPAVFEGAGPKCIRLNKCPEGKMSCGKFEEIRKRYGEQKGPRSKI